MPGEGCRQLGADTVTVLCRAVGVSRGGQQLGFPPMSRAEEAHGMVSQPCQGPPKIGSFLLKTEGKPRTFRLKNVLKLNLCTNAVVRCNFKYCSRSPAGVAWWREPRPMIRGPLLFPVPLG